MRMTYGLVSQSRGPIWACRGRIHLRKIDGAERDRRPASHSWGYPAAWIHGHSPLSRPKGRRLVRNLSQLHLAQLHLAQLHKRIASHLPGSLTRRLHHAALISPRRPGDWLRLGMIIVTLLAISLAIVTRVSTGSQHVARLVGEPAPSFALPAEAHGQIQPGVVSLTDHADHPRLLVFFYTLCTHCLGELATVHEVASAPAADGTTPFDALYIDSPAENPPIPDAYVTRVGIDAPVLLDGGGQVAARYGISLYPTLVLLDTDGKVRATWTGEPSAADLRAAVGRLAT